MKKLFAIALSAVCLPAADTNVVLAPPNSLTNSIPFTEQINWTIDSNKIATLTIRTNFLTNWVALEMTSPNLPKKYIGVLQTNRVMWIIYAGKTNELTLDNLWTEDVRMRQAPSTRPNPLQIKK